MAVVIAVHIGDRKSQKGSFEKGPGARCVSGPFCVILVRYRSLLFVSFVLLRGLPVRKRNGRKGNSRQVRLSKEATDRAKRRSNGEEENVEREEKKFIPSRLFLRTVKRAIQQSWRALTIVRIYPNRVFPRGSQQIVVIDNRKVVICFLDANIDDQLSHRLLWKPPPQSLDRN